MKVLIAIPALDHCSTDFALSLASLMGFPSKHQRSLWCQKGSLIMDARNMGVAAARQVGADAILFLDSDMTFPPDTLDRLAAHARDIVGATYVRRTEPHNLLGMEKPARQPQGNLTLMEAMPFGCILLRMHVFEKLKVPYFQYLSGVNDAGEPFSVSEDIYFCFEALAKDIAIWQDTSLTAEVGHVGSAVFRP